MGAGGLNGELRDNPNTYIDSVLQYHLNGVRRTRTSGPHPQQFAFHTSNTNPSFPSSSSNPASNPSTSTESDEAMVCYSCSVNFTILKRKKNCSGCKRDFCKECFKEGIPLDTTVTNCLICRSLKAPHVHREYLQKIKIKDLCDFLQKKNISFQDCKEKRELIRLVLQSSPAQPAASGPSRTPPTQPSTAWTTHRSSNNSSSTARGSTSNRSENSTSTSTSRNTSSQDSESGPKPSAQNAVMRTIDDVKNIDQIYNLSVKELKRILITNCVDFRGCCEKNELLEKVSLLWNDKNKSKDKNPDDEDEEQICKVCMDNFIDCVLLECGHMVTCIGCSKKVTECPVCRQHIVRIVKVFKA